MSLIEDRLRLLGFRPNWWPSEPSPEPEPRLIRCGPCAVSWHGLPGSECWCCGQVPEND